MVSTGAVSMTAVADFPGLANFELTQIYGFNPEAAAGFADSIPERPDAVWLKRFFKAAFGIDVRVRGLKHYLDVWIKSNAGYSYPADFPGGLCYLCLNVVYPQSPDVYCRLQAGNVGVHSISLHRSEWVTVLRILCGVG